MSNSVNDIMTVLNSDFTHDPEKEILLEAIKVVKARKMSEMIFARIDRMEGLKTQAAKANNDIEKEKKSIETQIQKLDDEIARLYSDKDIQEMSNTELNRLIVRKSELEYKKKILNDALSRLDEIATSISEELPVFIKSLCNDETSNKMIEKRVAEYIKQLLLGVSYDQVSTGDDKGKQPVFNREGREAEEHPINMEGAKRLAEILNQKEALNVAADYAEALAKERECVDKQVEVQEREAKVGKIDTLKNGEIEEIQNLISEMRSDAKSIIDNNTAIVDRSSFSSMLHRIGGAFGFKGKAERETEKAISRMQERTRAHLERLENDPQYVKAFEFYRDSWNWFREGHENTESRIVGPELLEECKKSWIHSIPGDVLNQFAADPDYDSLKELIGMTALPNEKNRSLYAENYSIKIPKEYKKHIEEERKALPEERKTTLEEYNKATNKRIVAEEKLNNNPSAKYIYDNNPNNVIRWRSYLQESIALKAAREALSAISGVSEQEILTRIAEGKIEESDKFIADRRAEEASGFVSNWIKEKLKEVKTVKENVSKQEI